MQVRREYLVLLAITAMSVAARLAYLLRNQYVWWDEAVYAAMADAFSGNFYVFEYFRPPLWPLLLSALPKTIFAAKFLSFAVSFAAIPLIFWLARRHLDERKSILITFFYAFNHVSMFYAGVGTTESLSAVLLFASMLSFYNATEGEGYKYWIVSGVSLALSAMTKHMCAYMIVPMVTYLLLTSRLSKWKGFSVMAASGMLAILPWLASMQLLFGNPFYAQLRNIAMSTTESPLFYFGSLPLFLGIQGLLIIPALLHLKKDRFVILSAVVSIIGFALLSAVAHKEDRFLLAILPGLVGLEAIGLWALSERIKPVGKYLYHILAAAGIVALLWIFLAAPLMPADKGLESCIDFAGKYHTQNSITTSAPFFAFQDKKFINQMPWDPSEFTCDMLKKDKTDYVIYFEDWWYGEQKETYMKSAEGCLEEVASQDKCTVYRVV